MEGLIKVAGDLEEGRQVEAELAGWAAGKLKLWCKRKEGRQFSGGGQNVGSRFW